MSPFLFVVSTLLVTGYCNRNFIVAMAINIETIFILQSNVNCKVFKKSANDVPLNING